MLEIRNISTYYGHVQALKNVSLEVCEGEIVSIIGANGAGKSTLLNSISAVVPPRSGQIFFNGAEITRLSVEAVVGMGICQVPERRQVFSELTVYDNLLLGAYLRLSGGGSRAEAQKDMENIFELFPILRERSKQPAGTLSGGEQQMLAMGRAMMARPQLLLLDEPSMGLSPILVETIFKTITTIREGGATILLVEQNAAMALEIAHRGYVIESGVITLQGTGPELAHNDNVRRAYLGEG